MKIFINNFESVVAPEIIERGNHYFKSGLVSDLEEIDDNFWSAIVEGTETYSVKIKISKGEIVEWLCDCPYDLGPICKHEIATIYAIKERLSGEKLFEKKSTKGKKKNKRKTVADQIEEILEKASYDEIKDIVRDFALENIEFRNVLLTHFISEDSSGSNKSIYKRIIKESLRSGMDRHGFIDYWSGRRAIRGIEELLAKADQILNNKQIEQAALIYQTVIEETVPALQYADDSNGDFGGIIEWGFKQLNECTGLIKNEQTRKNLLDYCLSEFMSKNYEGWSDWQWEFIHIASRLIKEKDIEILFAKIDEMLKIKSKRENSFDKYDNERAVEIKLKIIKHFKGKDEFLKFIKKNLEYTPMRQVAIDIAIGDKKYVLAKELANDGIKLDTKRGWPGLVVEWMEWLYKIANKENNLDDVRKYAMKLFVAGEGFEYYDKLKSTYLAEEWRGEVDNILKSLKGTRIGYYSTYAEIFIREERWDDLLNLVKENPAIQIIESYRKYLEKYFPDELIALYEHAIRKMLSQATGRGIYQDACKMLRCMKKLGAPEKVRSLIKEFKEAYKNRKALLEELEMV